MAAAWMGACPSSRRMTRYVSLIRYATPSRFSVSPQCATGVRNRLTSVSGTAMTMADGVMTPAVSVTSAVGGIAVAKPSVLSDTTVISIVSWFRTQCFRRCPLTPFVNLKAFLIFLFGIQRFGTHRLSMAYAPIALLWLFLIGGMGIYNITTHPGILRAFDPSRMVMCNPSCRCPPHRRVLTMSL